MGAPGIGRKTGFEGGPVWTAPDNGGFIKRILSLRAEALARAAACAGKWLLLVALLLLAAADVHAGERRSVLIQPPRWVPISGAMVAEELCDLRSSARTPTEASAHALRCNLRHRR